MKFVLLEDLGVDKHIIDAQKEKLKSLGHELICYPRTDDLDTLLDETQGADALILANMPMDPKLIEENPNLKFIDIAFTGYDHVPVSLAQQKGITVSNASGYATDAVAELAVMGMIDRLRYVDELQTRARKGKTKAGLRGRLLKGKTVGIIGAGAIGKATARLAKAFGAEIVGYARRPIADPVFDRQLPLDRLLEESDIVSLHVPLSDSTRHLIGEAELTRMKPDAILVNTARGPIVDTPALARALQNKQIGGAFIDVFDIEPPLDPASSLLQAEGCTITPHIGFDSQESMNLRAQIVFDNLYAWLEGHPQNVVSA